jgi:hypothetical protein
MVADLDGAANGALGNIEDGGRLRLGRHSGKICLPGVVCGERQAKNRELEVHAAEIRLGAERRLGEMIVAQNRPEQGERWQRALGKRRFLAGTGF